jgi:beta-glucanase (GH16 family)
MFFKGGIATAQTLCHSQKVLLTEDGICPNGRFILAFEDDFDGNTIDTSKWRVKTGVVRDPNQKDAIQWFLPANAVVSDGTLKLVAKRDTFINQCFWLWINASEGMQFFCHDFFYSGAEIACRQDFTHGKYEMRCKIPKGKGMSTAFWMWGFNHANEIDAFEFTNETNMFGKYQEEKSAQVHAMNTHMDYEDNGHVEHCGMKYTGIDFSEDFHTFTVIWTPQQIQWLVDDKVVRTSALFYSIEGKLMDCVTLRKGDLYYKNRVFPMYPMHIIASMCVQSGKGMPDQNTILPNNFEIDFIRYYRLE